MALGEDLSHLNPVSSSIKEDMIGRGILIYIGT
jgi:hypothetical protein